jgi:hypothetical protein
MEFIRLPYLIAALDIETYSPQQNAVVDEIGVIITNILPVTGAPWSLGEMLVYNNSDTSIYSNVAGEGSILKCLDLKMEVLEQVLAGRDVNPDTIGFRRSQCATAAKQFPSKVLPRLYEEYANQASRSTIFEAKNELLQFFGTVGDIQEVWMQHPQFDSTRVCNLLGNGYNVPWWSHRAERDVATTKADNRALAARLGMPDPYLIPKEYDVPRLDHVGIEDCFYNLWVLAKTRLFQDKLCRNSRPE